MSTPSHEPFCLVKSSINVDETFDVPHIVKPGETISSTGLNSRPGGKGANVSAAIALAGAQVSLSAAVGTDATWPVQELERRNVDVRAVEVLQDQPTGRAFIQIAEDGENSIVLLKGANYSTSSKSSDPSQVFGSTPRPVTHLMVQNEIPIQVTTSFLLHSRKLGSPNVTTIFNPSPMPSVQEILDFPWSTIDVLIVNEGEALELLNAFSSSSRPPLASSDQEAETVLTLLGSEPRLESLSWIVMTRGSKGVYANVRTLSQPLQPESSSSSWRLYKVPAYRPVQVRDTTGAGDTFAGNLVSGLMGINPPWLEAGPVVHLGERGCPAKHPEQVESILRWAVVAASVACETEGALNSIPDSKVVAQRMSQE
ncbi:Ribokinase-like protein [Violaceomyces palustris]|uniref:Ribokinase-like protein n=1 Tax=Violaceomyces palustris TaxID=1673888 RepID=A0ACD0P385_9BASI|nr:Ribokinase-like protein [Violaceomyces palustris]